MNRRQFERLGRDHLVPLHPGFEAKGEVVYERKPAGSVRGFLFERTGHPGGRDFYLWAFIQPLFVPASSFVLSFGKRVGSLWTLDDGDETMKRVASAARKDGLPFLKRVETNPGFAKELRTILDREPQSLYAREALAGVLVLTEKADEALAVLEQGPPPTADEPEWASADRRRMGDLAAQIAADPSDTSKRLQATADETFRALVRA